MAEGNIGIEELDKQEEERQINELGEIFKTRISENNGIFSEALKLNPRGKIHWETADNGLASKFVHMAIADQDIEPRIGFEPIFTLAKKINDRFPELQFSFKQDPEGGSLTYSVVNAPQVEK